MASWVDAVLDNHGISLGNVTTDNHTILRGGLCET